MRQQNQRCHASVPY